ncbi:hypothetical protein ECANGB1_1923 [Enterospora canceri]|uniref:Uncharacterized protein n=1 Tax=Enterospora canceri TaxID=1081671 RepID=A0A1Y1SA83_9MICR|nr:hypothetical protein ECANGB1_1923 [Enterospora canceri]
MFNIFISLMTAIEIMLHSVRRNDQCEYVEMFYEFKDEDSTLRYDVPVDITLKESKTPKSRNVYEAIRFSTPIIFNMKHNKLCNEDFPKRGYYYWIEVKGVSKSTVTGACTKFVQCSNTLLAEDVTLVAAD